VRVLARYFSHHGKIDVYVSIAPDAYFLFKSSDAGSERSSLSDQLEIALYPLDFQVEKLSQHFFVDPSFLVSFEG